MTWLQQLVLAVSATTATLGSVAAGPWGDVAHVPDADVAYRPEKGVEARPALSIDVSQLDVPVIVDVLRRPGQAGPGPVAGETLIGIATTDGRSVTLQGPAVNEGQPLTLGPDCQPLEPQAEPAGRR